MKSTAGRNALMTTALAAGFISFPASAATIDKADNADDLNLTSSWTGGVVPGPGDVARWSGLAGANAVALGADLSFSGLNIGTTGGDVSITAGNKLTLGTGGIDMSTASQDLAISSNLGLAAGAQVWNVASGRTLSLDTGTFTRTTGSILNLQGSGTVAAGMAGMTNTNSILGPWGTVGTGTATRYATIMEGNLVSYTSASVASTAGSAWGGIPSGGDGTVNWDITISGTPGATGLARNVNTIRYTGSGMTQTSNTSAVLLTTNGIMNSGTGTFIIGGGATALNVAIGSGNELVLNAANAGITLNNVVSGASGAGITVAGSGSNAVTLAGANTFTGATVVTSGTLIATNGASLGTNATGTTVFSGATLDVRANIGTEALSVGGVGANSAGALIAGSGTGTIGGTVTLTGNTTVGGAATLNINGAIGDGGNAYALTKAGAGTTTLSAANTYTGATTISAGTLALAGTTGALSTSSGITNNGIFTINRTNAVVQGTDFSGAGITGTGALNATGTGLTLTLNTANGYSGTTTIGAAANNSVVRATASGALGSGTIQLDSTGNASAARLELSGGITLANPLIQFAGRNNSTVGIQNISGNNELSGTLNLQSGGSTHVVQSDSGTLTLSGAIANASGTGTRTLTVTGAGDGLISGAIGNGTGTTALTKSGDGTWTLGNTSTYTGATSVSAGTLLVNGSLGNTAVGVTGGTLGGTGTIAGAVSVSGTGGISAGASIESLGVGALTMGSGTTFFYEAADNSGTGADLVAVAGTLSLTGVNLDLTGANLASAGWAVGDKLTLISYTGTGITSGFSGFDDDTLYAFGSNQWLFDYNDTEAGNNFAADAASGTSFVTMTVVPEPGVALLGSLGMLALLRRRRN